MRLHLARHRREHRTNDTGLALLDVLLGMAVFALIAIIAVQSMGMFRERAYVTTAVSDAKQVGAGITATMTKPGFDPTSTDASTGIPSGTLDDIDLGSLGVHLTGQEGESLATVARVPDTDEDFAVCVEHKGAYALYGSAEGGLTDSGTLDADAGPMDCYDVLFTKVGWPPAGPDLGTEAGCVEAGYPWIPEQAAHTETAQATLPDFYKDSSTGAWQLPWASEYGPGDYEFFFLTSIGSTANSVDMSWWPTTTAEKSRFTLDSSVEPPVLRRDGSGVELTLIFEDRPAFCNLPK